MDKFETRCCGRTINTFIYEHLIKYAYDPAWICPVCQLTTGLFVPDHLPKLIGTDKQVLWAVDIRANKIAGLDAAIEAEKQRTGIQELPGHITKVRDLIHEEPEASVWIKMFCWPPIDIFKKYHNP